MTGSVRKPQAMDALLGRYVREARVDQGLTQEKLAEGLNLTFQQVQKYEAGANRISASRLIQIAEVLGVAVTRLMPTPLTSAEARELAKRIDALPASDKVLVEALVDALNTRDRRMHG